MNDKSPMRRRWFDSTTFRCQASVAMVVAVLLTLLFWGPLWLGYGFIGGDLYPYFFPQKAFLADRLRAGEFPLWNNLTGFGYPILGESQTGVAYPPHLVTYYFLDVNTAYNVEHLLHYVLCFIGTWLFARRIGIGVGGSLLTAITFTYGWFPPRACLEWAILTGSWLPVALWCTESFLQKRWWRYAIGLSFVLGLQLLGGHFHLAFITQLLVFAYALWRTTSINGWNLKPSKSIVPADRWYGRFAPLVLAIVAGFLIAAIQLVPAWELKTRSSRATVGADHDPSYGHLPPLYASQLFAPWLWYCPLEIEGNETVRTIAELGAPWHWFGPHRNLDEALMNSRSLGLTNVATNKVEAHLYCGLAPLALAIWWLLWASRRSESTDLKLARQPVLSDRTPQTEHAILVSEKWFWLFAGGLALIYSTGWMLQVARFIPGFNFFRGPGRYGIVTTLAVAIFAGRGLQALLGNRQGIARAALLSCIVWSTIGDLWLVSRMVTYAVMRPNPAISFREQSPIRQLLLASDDAPRLYVRGQNLGNLLGVSCVPVYLGIAPSEYADPKFAGDGMPRLRETDRQIPADDGFSNWMRSCGVTHILSFHPLDETQWRAKLVWQGIDRLLISAWGRYDASGQPDPLFLYQLLDSPGRVSIITDNASPEAIVSIPVMGEANRFTVNSSSVQETIVVLRELEYPGWNVAIDGLSAPDISKGIYREVRVPPGNHQIVWSYRPFSVTFGFGISLATLFVLAAIAHLRFWHRNWLDRVFRKFCERRSAEASK